MKKILLVCAAGMSTSMLVKRMIDHATTISLEVNISALAIAEAKGKIKNNEVELVTSLFRWKLFHRLLMPCPGLRPDL